MQTQSETRTNVLDLIRELGPEFGARAAEYDANDRFVAENYLALKERGFFAALIPEELGGGGVPHSTMCRALGELATYCSSTALATSMHSHLVATSVWKYRHGDDHAGDMLRRVADESLVLVSTGATDWVRSVGSSERVDGGYRVTARKVFASGCPMGDMLITSAPYMDPDEGPQVLHFPLPIEAEGVSINENWVAMGMRGTGSHTVVLDNVFVPDGAIAMRRPQDEWPKALNVVVTVAYPLVMSVYAGIAEAAARIGRERAAFNREDPILQSLVGEMENALTATQITVESMIALANDYDFEPTVDLANAVLKRKTLVGRHALATVEKALAVAGGGGYFRASGLERLFRDVRAGYYHQPAEPKQLLFAGRVALGLDPPV